MENEDYNKKLKDVMIENNLSVHEISVKSLLSPSTVMGWVNGSVAMTSENYKYIKAAIGI